MHCYAENHREEPPTWDVMVEDVDGETHTYKAIHNVRHDGDWVIIERYDGEYGSEYALRAWRFHGSRVKKLGQY